MYEAPCLMLCCLYSCTDSFFAAVQVVSAFPGTCVEVWKVDGDSYRLSSSQYLDLSHLVHTFPAKLNQDITGILVNSTKPIGVYAGHSCAFVPENVFYCDHMVEQIPPVSELGKEHIVPPIVGRDANAGYDITFLQTANKRLEKLSDSSVGPLCSRAFD